MDISTPPSPSTRPDSTLTPAAPPTLPEIIALTRHLLSSPSSLPTAASQPNPTEISNHGHDNREANAENKKEEEEEEDHLLQCGVPALHLLRHCPDAALQFGYEKLHAVPYREVKTRWRRYYTDAAVRKVLGILESVGEEDWITQVVRTLDMALILTAAPGREELIELIFSALEAVIAESEENRLSHEEDDNALKANTEAVPLARPFKKRKLDPSHHRNTTNPKPNIPQTFPTALPAHALPTLQHPLPRIRSSSLSLSAFQSRITDPATASPFIITGAIDFWPAMSERPWNSPAYLLERTLGGRRLVPVEVGRTYTDEGWGQRVMSFGEFMEEFMFDGVEEEHHHPSHDAPQSDDGPGTASTKRKRARKRARARKQAAKKQTGYLAQHDLFAQIPSFRSDLSIPDYCYVDLPSPSSPSCSTTTNPPPRRNPEKLSTPLLNAWFGPRNTISPLHTDPYHNILAQVVGRKYIRLYAPGEGGKMYPRGKDERGVDMGNTSLVDLDVAMGVWGEVSCWRGGRDKEGQSWEDIKAEYEHRFPLFRTAAYVECVLGPGECLYIPPGWWHYVRSLTPSFSVSFWFI
ncbi:Clavaminate synthase-like protein [Westerdykella ornata]|uniref:Clavaminate synthase-like protein n=1 Tax=Westerdykella ornata TaxID=318751 RepID=A0A6A6JKD0_WESOR|nr:Clavaminate synthase-like protein [Westerdykella ornata]KAF2277110.1 Clavaminate synthase-like protein [Westerdykella ornata]